MTRSYVTDIRTRRRPGGRKQQHVLDLLQREAEVAASAHEVQALQVLASIHTIVASRSLAYRQQTGPLVVADGDNCDAGTFRQVADSEG